MDGWYSTYGYIKQLVPTPEGLTLHTPMTYIVAYRINDGDEVEIIVVADDYGHRATSIFKQEIQSRG
jgi:hypothetical protein